MKHSQHARHRCHVNMACSGWNCQPWPSRSQNWMFVYFIIKLSRSQQFPTGSSQNQVELGEWATGHFMHWACNPWLETWDVAIIRLGPVPYFPDMSGWTSGPIFSGEVPFFLDIDRGTSGGDFENYAEPTTHVFRCFKCGHTHYKNYS